MNFLRRSAVFSLGKKFSAAQTRQSSALKDVPSMLQQNVWRKSNTFYLAYIVIGCVIFEGIYGTVTNSIWENYNRGVKNINFVFVDINITFAFVDGIYKYFPIFSTETIHSYRLEQVQIRGRRIWGIEPLLSTGVQVGKCQQIRWKLNAFFVRSKSMQPHENMRI